MGIISDFVLATEEELRAFVGDRSRGADLPHHAVQGVMSEHVGSLVEAAAELTGGGETLEAAFELGDDGPWGYRFPEATARVLGHATRALRVELATRWRELDAAAAHEHGPLGEMCTELIAPICELAARADDEHRLFLVISI